MLCRNPYTSGAAAYPCGQCMPCRLNRRRVWSHRIVLESLQHGDNTFCTLTYDDDHLPPGANLVPRDLQLFLKRLRFTWQSPIRFYGVGEYGDQTQRPHYHVALFGFPNCRRGLSYFPRVGSRCCAVCDIVSSCWPSGNILLAELNEKTASYVAGYVTKKMTSVDDARLLGRHPEFARMSNRPGIGYSALHEVASELIRYDNSDDVPTALRHGKKALPLGRYLRRKLRVLVGLDENAPQATLDKMAAELSPLYEAAFNTPRPAGAGSNVFKTLLVEQDAGKVAQIENRNRVFKQRRSL